MNSSILINSIGIGAAIFAGLVLLWFLRTFFKRRDAKNQTNQIAADAQKISWEEKRKHPRVLVSWPARMEIPQESLKAQLKDISLGGAFVVCSDPLPLAERFRIFIEPPEQTPLELNAEVVWSNANVPEDKIINRGMGIRFVDNSDKIRSRLNDVITLYIETE